MKNLHRRQVQVIDDSFYFDYYNLFSMEYEFQIYVQSGFNIFNINTSLIKKIWISYSRKSKEAYLTINKNISSVHKIYIVNAYVRVKPNNFECSREFKSRICWFEYCYVPMINIKLLSHSHAIFIISISRNKSCVTFDKREFSFVCE